jgi:hypothetical protein
MGAQLFHVDGQTEGKKFIVAFHSSSNMPKIVHSAYTLFMCSVFI